MGKNKQSRSTASASEFTGFAAFSSHSSAASTAAAALQAKNALRQRPLSTSNSTVTPSSAPKATGLQSGGAIAGKGKTITPSPIYTGSNPQLVQIFKRISKKDSITKSRALTELSTYAFPINDNVDTPTSSTSSTPSPIETELTKAEQISALSHFYFLLGNKLIHENTATVRRSAIQVLGDAIVHVPKACRTLLSNDTTSGMHSSGDVSMGNLSTGSIGNVLGWIFTFQTSMVSEEQKIARKVWNQIIALLDTSKSKDDSTNVTSTEMTPKTREFMKEQIVQHVESVLQCSARPSNLAEALSVLKSQNQPKKPVAKEGGKKKGKKGNAPIEAGAGGGIGSSSGTMTESEKEEMEERYERVVLVTLNGMSLLLQTFPEETADVTDAGETKDRSCTRFSAILQNESVLWKHLASTRGNFRRATYSLISTTCQFGISVIHPLSSDDTTNKKISKNLSSLLLNSLASERNPVNFPILFEMMLLYISSFRQVGKLDQIWSLGNEANDDDDAVSESVNEDPSKVKPSLSSCSMSMDLQVFIKTLSKILRRACYGSSCSDWSPTILPLLASLPRYDGESHLKLLTSLWHGKSETVSRADALAIVAAVAECSSFLLLRKYKDVNDGVDEEVANDYGQIFLDSFSYFIAPSDGTSSSSSLAEDHLAKTLIRELAKLDEISKSDGSPHQCAFQGVKDWFWGEGMASILLNVNDNVIDLSIHHLNTITKGLGDLYMGNKASSKNHFHLRQSHLSHHLRTIFGSILSTKRTTSLSTTYVMFISTLLKYCGIHHILASGNDEEAPNATVHDFCRDYMKPWITSHCSATDATETSVTLHFEMLHLCLKNMNALEKKQCWEMIVCDLVQGKCDLKRLAIGLRHFGSLEGETAGDIMQCDALDSFAIQVGEAVVHDSTSSLEIDGMEHSESVSASSSISSFLRVCVGLETRASKCIVAQNVFHSWIQLLSQQNELAHYGELNRPHILLEILFRVASRVPDLISQDEALQLVMIGWKQGGPTWYGNDLKSLLSEQEALLPQVVINASAMLRRDIEEGRIISEGDIDLASYAWSKRASRLLEISNIDVTYQLGLHQASTWESAIRDNQRCCDALYLCLMYSLQNTTDSTDSNAKRSQLLVKIDDMKEEDINLLVLILCTLVEHAPSAVQLNHKVARCDHFLSSIGGVEELKSTTVEACCFEAVKVIEDALKQLTDGDKGMVQVINRGVVVLDWLVSLLRQKEMSCGSDEVDMYTVKKNDELWYMIEGKDESPRVRATITNVHTDDYPNLYFSIQFKKDGENVNRQTICSRLRTRDRLQINSDEFSLRLEERILYQLVKPFLLIENPTESHTSRAAAECLNIAVSRCGLKGRSGLGTVRYDVFQMVSKLHQTIVASAGSESLPISTLEVLSLILGYGEISSSSSYNIDILKFNGEKVMNTILGLEEDTAEPEGDSSEELDEDAHTVRGIDAILDQIEHSSRVGSAILTWLTVSATSCVNTKNVHLVWEVLEKVTSSLDPTVLDDSVALKSLRAIDAVHSVASSIKIENEASFLAVKQRSLSNLVAVFTKRSEKASSSCQMLGAYFVEESPSCVDEKDLCTSAFVSFMVKNIKAEDPGLHFGVKDQVEDLCSALKTPSTQWCSYQLLTSLSKRGMEIYSEEDLVLGESTSMLLDMWKETLRENEADELEEDVLVAGRWLPNTLMSDIENWKGSLNLVHDDTMIIAFMLEWLLCLDFLDAAAYADMRNRSHICSYIEKTGAVKEVIEKAMEHTTLEVKEDDWISCNSLERDGDMTLSQVSKLVVFRSIQAIPTLCKSWWTDYCPRSLQASINKFVESKVSPETLRLELNRIKKATNLGDMVVNGSCVSREVTATYVQDECNLSVNIKIPLAFPLRNVEVDCQKTLGIAQKRWRHWSLQIMRMLNNQDGSVLDALLLWKQNVDKEFEGVEPCPICYSVLCVKSHIMPNLECKNCHNRFHSTCLYKWFNTSGKSQCPLCQQPWAGMKISG